MNRRIQLTLFINENSAQAIEQIRKTFNPEQAALIKSHVTLCREDELESLDTVLKNITAINLKTIAINFGPITRFADAKGVMLPAQSNNSNNYELLFYKA